MPRSTTSLPEPDVVSQASTPEEALAGVDAAFRPVLRLIPCIADYLDELAARPA